MTTLAGWPALEPQPEAGKEPPEGTEPGETVSVADDVEPPLWPLPASATGTSERARTTSAAYWAKRITGVFLVIAARPPDGRDRGAQRLFSNTAGDRPLPRKQRPLNE